MIKDSKTVKVVYKNGPFGGTYLVTYVGAAIYFVQHSTGFWGFIVALLKAAVWPAFIVHRALALLKI